MKRIPEKVKCKAIVTEIEVDLRKWIVNELLLTHKLDQIIDPKTIESLNYKSQSEDQASDDTHLINYADYGQCLNIINKNKKKLTTDSQLIYQNIETDLLNMKHVRDRCAHGNLWASDIDETYTFLEKIKKYKSLFSNIFGEIKSFDDPNHIEFLDDLGNDQLEKGAEIDNNLPEIDCDETGFIGRINIKKKIERTLKKNSVVVLTGDAGIGKTSIVLDKCHEYKRNLNLFDEIKWYTFKTQIFSNNEIKELNNSLDIINFFNDENDKDDEVNTLLNYIQNKKCLLILDNLETVLDHNFKNFLEKTHEVDHESKIIITSREPVDAGITVKIEKFDDNEAESLFRKYSNYLSLHNLKKKNSIEIKKLNNQRDNNPLAIKLSLDDVYNGTTVEKAFIYSKNFLSYSYKNIFEKLDENSKEILEMLYYLNEEFTLTTICTYTGIDPEVLEVNLQNLDRKRFLVRDLKKSGAEYFSLREVIRSFFRKENIFKDENKKNKIIKNYAQIKTTKTENQKNSHIPDQIRHDWDSFYKRKDSDDEAINELIKINRYILDRVRLVRDSKSQTDEHLKNKIIDQIHLKDQETFKKFSFLKKKHRDYCEVFRVEGIFFGHVGSLKEMKDSFSKVFELAKDYPNPRAYYVERLRDLHEYEASKSEGLIALEIFPENIEIKFQLLQSMYYCREFNSTTKELASFISQKAKNSYDVDFHFARKLAKTSLEYHGRLSEFLIKQGGHDNFKRSYNEIIKLAENFQEFEKLHLVDFKTTQYAIKKSFGQIHDLRKYFSEGEEFEKLTEIKDIFSQKVNQYIGAKRIKRQTFSYVTDKYLSSHNKSNEESQELIIGKTYEGKYIGAIAPNGRKFNNFIGGFVDIDNGYFKDIYGRYKRKIFIHASQNIIAIPIGSRISFEVSNYKDSVVGINPKKL